MHEKLADFEITGVFFTFNAGVSSEKFDIKVVVVNVTPCNWGVFFPPNTGVSLEFYKESVWVNKILCTEYEEFNRLEISKSTNSEFLS